MSRSRIRFIWAAVVVVIVAGLAALPAAASTHSHAAKSTLVVLSDDIAPGLDPDGPTAASPAYIEAFQNLADPLVEYPTVLKNEVLTMNYKATAQQMAPRLATSWTKNGLVWTFKLRQGVKSCAGNEFSADDVIYTFARGKSLTGATPVAWFLGNVAGVLPLSAITSKDPKDKVLKDTEVKKIDKYTVQFTQEHPSDLFPRVLQIIALMIFDSAEMKKHATAKDPWSHDYSQTVNAPGFGPYCLSKWVKGSELDFTANPNYYRGKPQFTTIIERKVPSDSSRIASLLSGQADVVQNLTPQEYAKVNSSSTAKVLSWRNNKVTFLGLNFKYAAWTPDKTLVRQAIAYAMPYDEILKGDYLGTATKWNAPCESTYNGAVNDPRYTTNIAKAKELMAKAGYPDGKGFPTEGLQLMYTSERATLLEPIANRIRTALSQIGINVTLTPLSQTEYQDHMINKHDAPMFVSDADRPLGPDVGYCALLWYVSASKGGLIASTHYDNADLDALYAKSAVTVGAARQKILVQLQQKLMTDLPFVPIAEVPSQLAVSKSITNWKGMGLDGLYFWDFKTTS